MGLSMPVIIASSVGAAVARLAPFWAWRRRDIPVMMTRPMTSGGLVAAKFGMAAVSVLLAWAVTLAALALLIVSRDTGGKWRVSGATGAGDIPAGGPSRS